ncbi:hypothetical protein [Bradyrhizobium sp. NAS80.1]|uniref:hypothetical protein n=1 Tax=Bradyrhizobium sp. NAS80.1 TaxID=1680159 RepID=UPI0011612CB9|nr:hypothetical protein [Bradyrhizobium sp. NAS80.1]
MIISYLVLRDDPPQEWHRKIKVYRFAFWAVALSATLGALDPRGSASWTDGFKSLSTEQNDQFIQIFDLRDVMNYDVYASPPGYVLRYEDAIAEILLPGSSSAAKKIRPKAGSIDPYLIGNYLATQNASLGKAFTEAVERENRTQGLSIKLIDFASRVIFLLGFLVVHGLVAPKGVPLKTTARPYLLVTGAAAALVWGPFWFGMALVHYLLSTGSVALLYSELAFGCFLLLLIAKRQYALAVVYERSQTRIYSAVILSYLVVYVATVLVANGLLKVVQRLY